MCSCGNFWRLARSGVMSWMSCLTLLIHSVFSCVQLPHFLLAIAGLCALVQRSCCALAVIPHPSHIQQQPAAITGDVRYCPPQPYSAAASSHDRGCSVLPAPAQQQQPHQQQQRQQQSSYGSFNVTNGSVMLEVLFRHIDMWIQLIDMCIVYAVRSVIRVAISFSVLM